MLVEKQISDLQSSVRSVHFLQGEPLIDEGRYYLSKVEGIPQC